MTLTFHGLIVLTYLAISAAFAMALPSFVPEIGPDISRFVAGGLFLVSALMYQGAVQAARTRRLLKELKVLQQANATLRAELNTARREFQSTGDRPLMAGDAISSEEPVDEEFGRRELAMLKTILSQLPRRDSPITAANDEADEDLREEEGPPLQLSGSDNGPLAASGAGAAPTARSATARQFMAGQSKYHRHLVTNRPSASPPAMPAQSLRSDAEVLAATRDALERARVTLFIQPIVSLPNRRIKSFETYSRIRTADDELIGPEHYLRIAYEAGLIPAIDNNLLFRCIQLMRRLRQHERGYGFFCNVSPFTVSDNTFFPQFIEFLGRNDELSGNIIFEFTQMDIEAHYPSMADGLKQMAHLGYGFSLDQLTRYNINFKALADRQFQYVKLNTRKIL